MRLAMRAYRTSKSGRSLSECEDAVGYSSRRGVGALSDGASSSARAGDWSALLVRSFLSRSVSGTFDPEHAWNLARRSFDEVVAEDSSDGWWSDEVDRRGSFATIVRVEFHTSGNDLGWRSMAIGDSCLFHVRDGHLLEASPLSSPDAFDSSPELIGSSSPPDTAVFASGTCGLGDCLLLASDALSRWALFRDQRGDPVWAFLLGLRSSNFERFVELARSTGEMEDDDVSMLRCEVVP